VGEEVFKITHGILDYYLSLHQRKLEVAALHILEWNRKLGIFSQSPPPF